MKKFRAASVGVALIGAAALAAAVYGQEKKQSVDAHKIVHFGDLKWTPILKGCELAGVYADGARIPAHWHPTDENVTVLQGTFRVGMGETFDESKLQTMNVGNFAMMPKEMRHYATFKGETTVQLHGAGPFKVNWVNPSEVPPPDAPAAAAKQKS
jgi:hypothetical protein